jgi:aminoglycoside phosphotransferase (APT) family kinase protein
MLELGNDRVRLDRALASVLGWGIEGAEVEALTGGLNNDSYLVTRGDHRYVIRLTRPNAGTTLTLDQEWLLLQAAAAAGAAPEPVGIDATSGALVVRHVGGAEPWTASRARDLTNIARITPLLRRLHAVPARVRKFAPLHHANRYIAAAGGDAALAPADREQAAELRALAVGYLQRYPATVVCHNDLVAANILDDGELKLIDFEYAALAAPVLDLASLAAMNDFGSLHREALLAAYFAPRTAPFSHEEFAKVVRLVALIAYFWKLASPEQE